MDNALRLSLRAHFSESQIHALASTRVGIAGAGGLGSNAALMLVRSGIEHLLLVDDDVVELSNLNRQQYWPSDLGKSKVEALAARLRALNPDLLLDIRATRLGIDNMREILRQAPIWVEALDRAEIKSVFVEEALGLSDFVVAASGICGYGGEPLRKTRLGNLVVAGDFHSAHCEGRPPLAPRVTQAAAIMADCVLEYILDGKKNSATTR